MNPVHPYTSVCAVTVVALLMGTIVPAFASPAEGNRPVRSNSMHHGSSGTSFPR